jgi:hypothetical protein
MGGLEAAGAERCCWRAPVCGGCLLQLPVPAAAQHRVEDRLLPHTQLTVCSTSWQYQVAVVLQERFGMADAKM